MVTVTQRWHNAVQMESRTKASRRKERRNEKKRGRSGEREDAKTGGRGGRERKDS